MNKEKQEQYKAYVEKKTPKNNVYFNMIKAFITGGIICVVGQAILDFCKSQGLSEEIAGSWTSLILVLISVILTGFNIYPRIAQWGGAGALVPITGFANSVVSAAMEYKSEGFILGVGAKMFTIAGPVIVYGTVASVVVGLIYWIMSIV